MLFMQHGEWTVHVYDQFSIEMLYLWGQVRKQLSDAVGVEEWVEVELEDDVALEGVGFQVPGGV